MDTTRHTTHLGLKNTKTLGRQHSLSTIRVGFWLVFNGTPKYKVFFFFFFFFFFFLRHNKWLLLRSWRLQDRTLERQFSLSLGSWSQGKGIGREGRWADGWLVFSFFGLDSPKRTSRFVSFCFPFETSPKGVPSKSKTLPCCAVCSRGELGFIACRGCYYTGRATRELELSRNQAGGCWEWVWGTWEETDQFLYFNNELVPVEMEMDTLQRHGQVAFGPNKSAWSLC